jgi:hypothetical protein
MESGAYKNILFQFHYLFLWDYLKAATYENYPVIIVQVKSNIINIRKEMFRLFQTKYQVSSPFSYQWGTSLKVICFKIQ